MVYELDIDIIGIQETHLGDNSSNQPSLEGYEWVGHCRKTKHVKSKKTYGGIGIFIKRMLYDTYNISVIDKTFEGILGVLFKDKISDYSFTVFCCYLPPENSPYGRDSTAFFTHLLTMVYLHSYADNCFTFGDFNGRVSDQNDAILALDSVSNRNAIDFTINKHGEAFLDYLKESRMVITNGRINGIDNFTSISTKGKSVVDYVAVPIDNLDQCIACNVRPVSDIIDQYGFEPFLSEKCKPPDHSPICLTYKLTLSNYSDLSESSERPNTGSKRYNFNSVSNEFLKSDTWKNILDSLIMRLDHIDPLQESVDKFYDAMLINIFEEMDKHVSYKEASKTTRKLYRNHKPFWNDELSNAWKDVAQSEKCYIKFNHSHSENRRLREIFLHKRKLFTFTSYGTSVQPL